MQICKLHTGSKDLQDVLQALCQTGKRAEANYPIRKTAIVELNILDDFLEDNPEVVSELKKRKGKRYGK